MKDAQNNDDSPIAIFYAYAQNDQKFLNELEKHLTVLKRKKIIETWSDQQILPGEDWSEEIRAHLGTASIILLLISVDFLESNYGSSMKDALERHHNGDAWVLPIILRPCHWQEVEFLGGLKALPTDGKPVTNWQDQDQAFVDIEDGIRDVAQKLMASKKSGLFRDESQFFSREKKPRPAIWNIPFTQNPFFTAREEQLAQIRDQLQRRQSSAIGQVQAISGLGGIGKTQLAVEYAHRHSQDYKALLWVRADTLETLNASYSELAHQLNLGGKNIREQEVVVQAVQTWLATHDGWLLIFDNLDEPLVLFPPDEKGRPSTLSPFLPATPGGHILLTTRSDDLSSLNPALGLTRPLRLPTFTPEQGAHFLLTRADRSEQATSQDQQLATQIANELGGLALAIDQAGAYINATGIDLASYLQLFQQRRAEVLKQPRNILYPESVATTWVISFQRVEERNPAAAEFLRFSAFLAPTDIPEEILTEGANELGDILTPVAHDPLKLGAAVEALRAYSLITRNPRNLTFTIHRLVQAVQRDSLTKDVQQQWMQRAINAVASTWPELDFSGLDFAQWPTLERLLPHALICAAWIEQEQMMSLASVHLLERAGSYLDARVRYHEATPLLVKALAICERQPIIDYAELSQSLNCLATLYSNQGKFAEAEELFQRALNICEQYLGSAHLEVVQRLNNLADLYRMRGMLVKAEAMSIRALVICEQHQEIDYTSIVNSLTIQALLYWDQLKYTEAESLSVRALAICEQQFGTEHLYTAKVLNTLAMIYLTQGEYSKTEPLLVRALTICKQQFGTEHIYTTQCLNNLAELYRAKGNYGEAEKLFRQLLTTYEHQFGTKHPYVALGLNNLAGLYDNQRKYIEAEPLYQRALDIRQQQLEADHPDIIQSLNNLAMLYLKQGRYTEGKILSQQALDWGEQLGTEHLYTGLFLNNLACLYLAQRKYIDAKHLLLRAHTLFKQKLGTEHLYTVICGKNLEELYQVQEKDIDAEHLSQHALTLFEQSSDERIDTDQNWKNAESLFEHILIIRERGTIPQTYIRALTTWLGCIVSAD